MTVFVDTPPADDWPKRTDDTLRGRIARAVAARTETAGPRGSEVVPPPDVTGRSASTTLTVPRVPPGDTSDGARERRVHLTRLAAGNAGNPQPLIDWYNAGADGKIDWGQPGDFDACVSIAGDHVDDPQAFCAARHHDATGDWPGHASGESRASSLARLAYSDAQARDYHGRFGEGANDAATARNPGVTEIRNAATAYHGTVAQVTTKAEAAELRTQLATQSKALGIDPTAPLNEPGSDAGVAFTDTALNQMSFGHDDVVVFAGKADDGSITGAVQVQTSIARDALFVGMLGSTGITPGAGSAIMRQVAAYAAERGLGIIGHPVPDAKPFWSRMGFHDMKGGNFQGWTPDEVKAIAA